MKKIFLLLALGTSGLVQSGYADLPDTPVVFPGSDYGHHDDPAYYPAGIFAEWWYFNGQIVGRSLSGLEKRDLSFYISFHHHLVAGSDSYTVYSGMSDLDNDEFYFSVMSSSARPFSRYLVSSEDLHLDYAEAGTANRAFLRYAAHCGLDPAKLPLRVESRLTALSGEVMELNLILLPLNDPLQVNGGKIDMPGSYRGIENGESVYIAKTRLMAFGTVKIGSELILVNTMKSDVWFDHQFGDFLGSDSTCWEWFSLRLDPSLFGGYKSYAVLAAFVDRRTKSFNRGFASFIFPDGSVRHYTISNPAHWLKSGFLETPEGYVFPLRHEITIPELDTTFRIESSLPGQYAQNLYEGHCRVQAESRGRTLKGFAYKELAY